MDAYLELWQMQDDKGGKEFVAIVDRADTDEYNSWVSDNKYDGYELSREHKLEGDFHLWPMNTHLVASLLSTS